MQQNRKSELVDDLRAALHCGEFDVHFQPIIDLATGETVKAEALLRWNSPRLGLVHPSEFIPLLEETGLIHQVGGWVFDYCVTTSMRLEQKFGRPIQINMNLSETQLSQERDRGIDWAGKFKAITRPGKYIAAEIAESLLLNDSSSVTSFFHECGKNGVDIAIDDFDTEFASLPYLRKPAIGCLKIDLSFICGIADSPDDAALTEAIIAMAHKLGLKAIAEGVETREQLRVLQQFECDYVQGYLLSRPVPAAQFEKLVWRSMGWGGERAFHA